MTTAIAESHVGVIPELERHLSTVEMTKRYLFAGKAIFTVRSTRTGKRYTYKLTRTENDENKYFAAVMYGPDNDLSYRYIGMVTPNGGLYRTAKSPYPDTSEVMKALAFTLKNVRDGKLHPELEIWHSGRCGRCGRRLTVPESIQAGIGPECAQMM